MRFAVGELRVVARICWATVPSDTASSARYLMARRSIGGDHLSKGFLQFKWAKECVTNRVNRAAQVAGSGQNDDPTSSLRVSPACESPGRAME